MGALPNSACDPGGAAPRAWRQARPCHEWRCHAPRGSADERIQPAVDEVRRKLAVSSSRHARRPAHRRQAGLQPFLLVELQDPMPVAQAAQCQDQPAAAGGCLADLRGACVRAPGWRAGGRTI
jgi:hypothetical protein